MLSPRSRNLLVLCAVGMLAAGCADYMNRRDSVTFGAGNAIMADRSMQEVETFPPEAWNTHISTDGKVIYRVVTDYQKGKVPVPVGTAGMSGSGTSVK